MTVAPGHTLDEKSTPVVPFASSPRGENAPPQPRQSRIRNEANKLGRFLANAWYAGQVELWGEYSVERMLELDAFCRGTSKRRVVALLAGTFLPCLLVEMVLEALPLAPTKLGLGHSRNFWIRTTFMTYIVTHSLVAQYRQNVLGLQLSSRHIITISVIASVLVQPLLYLMATYIGYPIPFFMVLTLLPWTPLVVGMAAFVLRHQLRQDPNIRHAIARYTVVFNAQSCLIIVYPSFTYVFKRLPQYQTWLVLLLPVMKLFFRNWFSHASKHIEDLKPELVVFNVEIFSALYVSSCMQSATSIYSTIVIMVVDFVQACLSIKDLHDAFEDPDLHRIMGDLANTRQLIPLAQHLLHTDSFVRNAKSIRIDTCVCPLDSFKSMSGLRRGVVSPHPSSAMIAGLMPTTQEERTVRSEKGLQSGVVTRSKREASRLNSVLARLDILLHRLGGCHDSDDTQGFARLSCCLSDADKLLVVQKTLRILHIAEFVALVEYSEVVVPIVYSLFAIVAYTFPNRDYYANLNHLTATDFMGTLMNVLLYGSLELVSYVALDRVLKRRFHLSAFTHTAFVLDTQWAMVQSKLMLWTMVVLQFAHEHYGSDFSFQFKWLHKDGA